jgi:tetratricopeptide (TPR) repeat protein
MHHWLEGRWFFRCVTGMRNLRKGSSLSLACGPALQSHRLRSAISLAIAAIVCFASPARSAVDRSIIKSQEGGSALLRGRFDLAIAAYDEALKDTTLPATRQASLYSDRGVAKWRLRQLDGALADFTKAISLSPDYAVAYNNRGNVYMDMNRTEDAFKDFDRAVALSPAFGAAYSNRANANQLLKRLPAAENDFRKAIQLMPSNAVPLNGRGKIASAIGQYYTALRYLNRSITINAQYAPAYQNRATVLAMLKRNDEASQDFDKVIALAPDNADLYVSRGKVYMRDKRGPQAFRDFSKALELAPDNVQALIGRGAQNIDRRRSDLAVEDLNRAIALDPKAADAYFWRGQARYTMNDVDGADADLSKAIELDPNLSEPYRIRGSFRDRAGKRDDAIADYRRALELDPFSREARDAYRAASGDTADSIVKSIAPAVDGWEVIRSGAGQFTAVNERYPKMPILLEVDGEGPAQILEWTPLKDSLAGVGLLRYRGWEKNGAAREYVAIIDLSRSQIVSIEPYISGEGKSKWAWTPNAVTVTDVDGLSSYYELRKPRSEVPMRRDDGPFSFFGGGGRRGGGGPGVFGWLFQ